MFLNLGKFKMSGLQFPEFFNKQTWGMVSSTAGWGILGAGIQPRLRNTAVKQHSDNQGVVDSLCKSPDKQII